MQEKKKNISFLKTEHRVLNILKIMLTAVSYSKHLSAFLGYILCNENLCKIIYASFLFIYLKFWESKKQREITILVLLQKKGFCVKLSLDLLPLDTGKKVFLF